MTEDHKFTLVMLSVSGVLLVLAALIMGAALGW